MVSMMMMTTTMMMTTMVMMMTMMMMRRRRRRMVSRRSISRHRAGTRSSVTIPFRGSAIIMYRESVIRDVLHCEHLLQHMIREHPRQRLLRLVHHHPAMSPLGSLR